MTAASGGERGRDLENEHRSGIALSIESDVPGYRQRRRGFIDAGGECLPDQISGYRSAARSSGGIDIAGGQGSLGLSCGAVGLMDRTAGQPRRKSSNGRTRTDSNVPGDRGRTGVGDGGSSQDREVSYERTKRDRRHSTVSCTDRW